MAKHSKDDEAKERRRRIAEDLVVRPGQAAGLANRSTTWTLHDDYRKLSGDRLDSTAKKVLAAGVDRLADLQEQLWASGSHAVLVVFQALDAAGKDSTIEHVTSGVNPQGIDVVSFKQPSSEERAHTFLWRVSNALPERGRIVIFNRSHYEEVIALRVHPEWIDLPDVEPGPGFWADRYEDINAFERHLARNGTKIVKFFLHVSKAEQKRRFLARLDRPEKEWKFNAADVAERARWDDYMDAFETALTETSTDWAPWYVIPADHKHVMQALVAQALGDELESLDLQWPTVSAEEHAANEVARAELEAELERDDD